MVELHKVVDCNTFEMHVDAIPGGGDVIIGYHTKQPPWEHLGFKLSQANARELALAIIKATKGEPQ